MRRVERPEELEWVRAVFVCKKKGTLLRAKARTPRPRTDKSPSSGRKRFERIPTASLTASIGPVLPAEIQQKIILGFRPESEPVSVRREPPPQPHTDTAPSASSATQPSPSPPKIPKAAPYTHASNQMPRPSIAFPKPPPSQMSPMHSHAPCRMFSIQNTCSTSTQ
jgi:hypothetical protein